MTRHSLIRFFAGAALTLSATVVATTTTNAATVSTTAFCKALYDDNGIRPIMTLNTFPAPAKTISTITAASMATNYRTWDLDNLIVLRLYATVKAAAKVAVTAPEKAIDSYFATSALYPALNFVGALSAYVSPTGTFPASNWASINMQLTRDINVVPNFNKEVPTMLAKVDAVCVIK